MSNEVKCITDEFKNIVEAARGLEGFDSFLAKRLELVEAYSNGDVTFRFKVQPEDANLQGTLHGGMVGALGDMICSYSICAFDTVRPSWSTDLNISFIGAPKIGENILLKGKTPKYGKTLAFSTLEIVQESNNRLIAMARLTKMMTPIKL